MRSPVADADYLAGRKSIPVPKSRRKSTASIRITGAREHNLKNLDVEIPLGIFNCVSGVSGSGKSTLIHEVLYRNLLQAKGAASEQEPGACKSVTGAHRIGDVVMVDQSMLARTPRSTPILYLGLYDRVRELFAAQPEAMAQGLTASAFSFNSGSGRCERCCGTGFEKIEMQFLSDLYVRCAECEGRRFQPHVLRVQLHEKSIHDVLQLTVSEAIQFFAQIGETEKLSNPLDVLDEVGLGYLRLGQPLNTLSGGESQRLKLVRHLADESAGAKQNGAGGGNLLIFDEPTTGLHFDDVALLVKLFQRLVAAGNTLIVIEHNLEVIKCADWVIDLGPGGRRRRRKTGCCRNAGSGRADRRIAYREVSPRSSGERTRPACCSRRLAANHSKRSILIQGTKSHSVRPKNHSARCRTGHARRMRSPETE